MFNVCFLFVVGGECAGRLGTLDFYLDASLDTLFWALWSQLGCGFDLATYMYAEQYMPVFETCFF